mgnify:CR=1 FL=1|tara:strand:+ start:2946 stop:3152 length:207 start_codon:yes stop_codon:yes gene_type:complete
MDYMYTFSSRSTYIKKNNKKPKISRYAKETFTDLKSGKTLTNTYGNMGKSKKKKSSRKKAKTKKNRSR